MSSIPSESHEVFSGDSHQNENRLMNRKSHKLHQKLTSCNVNSEVTKKVEFLISCEECASKSFENKNSLCSNGFTDIGKLFCKCVF